MADIQEVEVTIRADGTVDVHVRGAKGDECVELTEKMEQYLGGDVVDRAFTDEYHAVEDADQADREELGD